jgi:hypothetical protein
MAALYRRPLYVSEDLLIYLPEPTGNIDADEMLAELVKAFRVAR